MSYESTAEPIKVGYLMDFTLPPPAFPKSSCRRSPGASTWSSKRPWPAATSTGRCR